jgi:serine phosphatase RsbU (regulator of sigma subunit)
MTTSGQGAVIEWGRAGTALEYDSGDLDVVVSFPGGALIALIDGLGHGVEAALAARAAAQVLEADPGLHVIDLVRRCHDALRKTRGAVMTVASLSQPVSAMTWIGVGNVDGVLLRGAGNMDAAVVSRGGVVGYQLPALRATTVPISTGDMLIMATDGIRNGFSTDIAIDQSPQDIADSIVARCSKGSDDACVVVARYLGGQA